MGKFYLEMLKIHIDKEFSARDSIAGSALPFKEEVDLNEFISDSFAFLC